MSQNSYLQEFCAQVSQIVFLVWFDRFTTLILLYEQKMSQNSYLHEFCAEVSQSVFLADLTVLRLITTVWAKMSQNSYLREFCAQVSQIVFLADLTVLRLITTVWAKMSQNSYLREFCAQVSQIVFLSDLTSLLQNVTKFICARVLCTIIKKRVLFWFDRFLGLIQLYERRCHKILNSTSCVHKYQKSCS